MVPSEIERLLTKSGFDKGAEYTYPKTFSTIGREKFLTEQVYNRGNASWKKGAVIIATYDNTNRQLSDYIDGWKSMAKYGDQILILATNSTDFNVYDSNGRFLGSGRQYIESLFGRSVVASDLSPLILYGAPGTGKTFYMQKEIYDKYPSSDRFFTTFHQSFCYEDFIEGLKPVLSSSNQQASSATPQGTPATGGTSIKYKIQKGLFITACERAAVLAGYKDLADCIADTPQGRATKMETAIVSGNVALLCIDEINRANISSVFGDMIPLIEQNKRLGAENELTGILTYSGDVFGVPRNLFIVGAMNTADRSIQLLDSALRRRFRFKEFLPDYKAVLVYGCSDAADILKKINSRVRALIDKDHQIGHSYFIGAKTHLDIVLAIRDKIIPQLEEYFYNQSPNIRKALYEENNPLFYVKDSDCQTAYDPINDEDDDREFYMLNPSLASVSNDTEADVFLKNLLP